MLQDLGFLVYFPPVVRSMSKGSEKAEEEDQDFDKSLYFLLQLHEFDLNLSHSDWISICALTSKRIRMSGNKDNAFDQDRSKFNSENDITDDLSNRPQDADYVPSLSDELENFIFAMLPRSEHWKLPFLNKRCLSLLQSGELYKVRKDNGFKEPSVFMFASGETSWWVFDREFKSRRRLPIVPSDYCFASGDKESLCAGTHLLVTGKEIDDGLVIWRYELSKNKWYKGPSMINPRCLFASATCGSVAYVAGGMGVALRDGMWVVLRSEVYNTAEKYNPEQKSWESLPKMRKGREFCSGCYMDNRFYVIGGRNNDGELTCGEFFDETKNRWELIPDMLKDIPVQSSHSPPLLAVANNELYSLDASSNQLKVYLKQTNAWKELGRVPVRADYNRGWGVAFKSLGNELLVIGASSVSSTANYMSIYICNPESGSRELQWRRLDSGRGQLSHFILNCSVMVA